MGFGILFFGYFATTMTTIPLARLLSIDLSGIAKLFGYILIIIAAKKLCEYNSSFKTLMVSSSLMALISFFEAAIDVSVFLVDNQISSARLLQSLYAINEGQILDYIAYAGVIIFIATLCLAIKQIAAETAVKKIEISATRNFVFYCILFIVQALAFMPFEWVKIYKSVFVAALLIIELLCWVLNLYMIFSCYAKICDSNDIDMKQKPSRFSFINEKRAEQEAERQKVLDEYTEKVKKRKKK